MKKITLIAAVALGTIVNIASMQQADRMIIATKLYGMIQKDNASELSTWLDQATLHDPSFTENIKLLEYMTALSGTTCKQVLNTFIDKNYHYIRQMPGLYFEDDNHVKEIADLLETPKPIKPELGGLGIISSLTAKITPITQEELDKIFKKK